MAAGAASAAARSRQSSAGGVGINSLANRGGILAMSAKAVRRKQRQGALANAVGGDNSRLDSIESRLDALEGSGGQDVTQPSPTVSPAPVGVPGGSEVAASNVTADNDSVSVEPPTTFATAPQAAAGDIFGKVFMRQAAVGAAKMIKNKKI